MFKKFLKAFFFFSYTLKIFCSELRLNKISNIILFILEEITKHK